MSLEPLKKLSVIHYSVIDQLLNGKSPQEIVLGMGNIYGTFITVDIIMGWMDDELFCKEYMKARGSKGVYTMTYAGNKKSKSKK